MADPRGVKHDNTGDMPTETFIADNSTITYDVTKTGGSAAVGKAVKVSGHKTVALVVDADRVWGRLERVEADLKCTIKWRGHMFLPGGNAATLTENSAIVGAIDASSNPGFIRAAAATAAEAVKARGTITDNTTSTAVEVFLH